MYKETKFYQLLLGLGIFLRGFTGYSYTLEIDEQNKIVCQGIVITESLNDELKEIFKEYFFKYSKTRLLLESIAYQIKELEIKKQIILKIKINADQQAERYGGYATNPLLEEKNGRYLLNILHLDLLKEYYRPIVFFMKAVIVCHI